jgi:hypothetical protein
LVAGGAGGVVVTFASPAMVVSPVVGVVFLIASMVPSDPHEPLAIPTINSAVYPLKINAVAHPNDTRAITVRHPAMNRV